MFGGYGLYYMDWTYLLIIGATILGLIAQSSVKSTFNKYSRVRNARGLTGDQTARHLLEDGGVHDVQVGSVKGSMTDHYDPRSQVVGLSQTVGSSDSVSALAVAAHECGHAMQHHEGYVPMRLRSALVPVANLGSQACMPLFFIGLIFNFGILLNIGIALFAFAVIFQLVTLPVELNASKRALVMLETGGYLTREETPMAKKVLRAAAMTYVAAALSSILQLLRLLMLANRRRD